MRDRGWPVWVVVAMGFWACTGAGQRGATTPGGWTEARIDSLVSTMPQLLTEYEVPGVSIVLTDGADVQWAAGFGTTGREGPAVTPQTVFQVASLGKPVFAHLVERLEAKGAWALHDPIAGWSQPGAYPPEMAALSAEALLGHTSGMRYDAGTDRVSVDAEARGQWSYSGAGYVLLQQALEGAESRSLEELSRSILFEPLGFGTMSYVVPRGVQVAVGHDRSGNALPALDWTEANAASSLYSSALDYGRFLILAAGVGDSVPASWARLTRPRATVREDLGLYWGLGWALEQDSTETITAFHWGSNPGFKSFALLDREREMGVIVLTNGDNGLELVEHILGIIDPKPHPLFEFYMLHPDD